MMIAPVITIWIQLGRFSFVHPFATTVISKAPISVPDTLADPPDKLAPPITHAAITESSIPLAVTGSPSVKYEN
jgi:hypothetical protein